MCSLADMSASKRSKLIDMEQKRERGNCPVYPEQEGGPLGRSEHKANLIGALDTDSGYRIILGILYIHRIYEVRE